MFQQLHNQIKKGTKFTVSAVSEDRTTITTMCHFFQIPELKEANEQDLKTSKTSVIDDLMNVIYVSLSVEILGFVASCLSFASSCADYGEATKRKEFVMPWVIWCFIGVAFNIGCVAYFYTALHGEIDMGKLFFRSYVNIISLVFCAIVGISYIINMKAGYRPQGHSQVVMARVPYFQGNPLPYTKLQA